MIRELGFAADGAYVAGLMQVYVVGPGLGLRAEHHLHNILGAALGGVVQRREPLVEVSSKSESK